MIFVQDVGERNQAVFILTRSTTVEMVKLVRLSLSRACLGGTHTSTCLAIKRAYAKAMLVVRDQKRKPKQDSDCSHLAIKICKASVKEGIRLQQAQQVHPARLCPNYLHSISYRQGKKD